MSSTSRYTCSDSTALTSINSENTSMSPTSTPATIMSQSPVCPMTVAIARKNPKSNAEHIEREREREREREMNRFSTHMVCRNGRRSMLAGSAGPYSALDCMLTKLRRGICRSRRQGMVPAMGPGVAPCAHVSFPRFRVGLP